jgi:hypothetical protein
MQLATYISPEAFGINHANLALLWQIGLSEGFPFRSIGDSWVVGLLEGRPWDRIGEGIWSGG